MSRGVVFVVAVIGCVTFALFVCGQGVPGARGGREGSGPKLPKLPGGGDMVVGKGLVCIASGGVIYKVSTSSMKVEATCELPDSGEQAEGPDSQVDELFRRLDKNGDGEVSREEWTKRPEMFGRLDRDGDGVITREEASQRLGGAPMKRLLGVHPVLRLEGSFLFVLAGEVLYKLSLSDLQIKGSLELGREERRGKKERKGKDTFDPRGEK